MRQGWCASVFCTKEIILQHLGQDRGKGILREGELSRFPGPVSAARGPLQFGVAGRGPARCLDISQALMQRLGTSETRIGLVQLFGDQVADVVALGDGTQSSTPHVGLVRQVESGEVGVDRSGEEAWTEARDGTEVALLSRS